MQVDVAAAADVAELVELTERAFGPADVLVNNAGVLVPRALVDLPEEGWDRTMAVNLEGCSSAARRSRAG